MVGPDLVDLYNSAQVQSYLNGIPARDLHHDKSIYQHGCLRKVRMYEYICKCTCTYIHLITRNLHGKPNCGE